MGEDGAWEDGGAIEESDDSRSDDSRSAFAFRLKKITRTRTGLAKNAQLLTLAKESDPRAGPRTLVLGCGTLQGA